MHLVKGTPLSGFLVYEAFPVGVVKSPAGCHIGLRYRDVFFRALIDDRAFASLVGVRLDVEVQAVIGRLLQQWAKSHTLGGRRVS
jgi:hypothetical protein